MELDEQVSLGHLLLQDRKCKKCGEIKNLIDGFYRTRKDRGSLPSSYSYECKVCTIRRKWQEHMTLEDMSYLLHTLTLINLSSVLEMKNHPIRIGVRHETWYYVFGERE